MEALHTQRVSIIYFKQDLLFSSDISFAAIRITFRCVLQQKNTVYLLLRMIEK